MTDLYTTHRFSAAGALTRFVRTVADRPSEAARLFAMDAVAIGLILGFFLFAWPAFMATKPPGWQEGPLAACAVVAMLLMYLMWETAWQRFLAGKPARAGLPWRLGHEEGLVFGASVVALILIGVLLICTFAVLGPFWLLLSQGAGAPPPVVGLIVAPIGLIVAFIAYRFICGVSLTIVQGRMSVFAGFSGVQRHLWRFAGALFVLTAVNTAVWVLFDLTRGVPVQSIALFAGSAGDMPSSWAGAGAYLILSALSTHIFRGAYMESALVTANLGPVSERGSGPEPLSTPAH